MKTLQIQAVFLVFVLIAPLAQSSIANLGDIRDFYELCENSSEEEQNEERESEEEKEGEKVKGFVSQALHDLALWKHTKSTYFSKNKKFSNINKDVLTPPPQFI